MADIFEFDCAKFFNLSDFDSFEECSTIDPWFHTQHEEHEPQFVADLLGDALPHDTDLEEVETLPVEKVSAPIVRFDVKQSLTTATRKKRTPESVDTLPSKKPSSKLYTPSLAPKSSRPSVSRSMVKSTKAAPVSKPAAKPTVKLQKSKSTTTTTDTDDALLLMLKQHNKKFAPTAAYVPPMHSVREVRQWEKISGKHWNSLSQAQREEVNEEISELKQAKRII